MALPTLPTLADISFGAGGQAARRAPLLTPEEEDSLLNDILSPLTSTLGYIGETFAKPSRIIHALPSGNPRELLNIVPFSDTLGLTDTQNMASGATTLENMGVIPKNEEGFDRWDIPRFFADVGGDPTTPFSGFLLGSNVVGKAGSLAQKIGAFPKRSVVGPTGDLLQGVRKARMGTLRSAIGDDADLLSKAKASAAATGDNLDELLDQRMGHQAGFGFPFMRPSTTFDLPGGDKIASGLDKIGHAVRGSKLGTETARLQSYLAKGASTLFGQQTSAKATEATDSAIHGSKVKHASWAQSLKEVGLDANDPEIAAKLSNAAEGNFYDKAATKIDPVTGRRETFALNKLSIDEAVDRNFAGLAPEQIETVRKVVRERHADQEAGELADRAMGLNSRAREDDATHFLPRKAEDYKVRGRAERRLETRQAGGARRDYGTNAPATFVQDVMTDKKLYDAVKAIPEQTIITPPAHSDIATLKATQFADLSELTGFQARPMAKAATAGEPISRTIIPPKPTPERKAFNNLVKDRILNERLGWTKRTWKDIRQLQSFVSRHKGADHVSDDVKQLVEGAEAELAAYHTRIQQARELAKRLAKRDPEDMAAGKPWFDTDLIGVDLEHAELDIARRAHAAEFVKAIAQVATRYDGAMPPDDAYNALDVFRKADFLGTGEKADPELGTNLARFLSPELAKNGVIAPDELERIVGSHAVVSSDLAAGAAAPVDGLNILSHLAVPKELADDMLHVMSSFKTPPDAKWWAEMWDKFNQTFKQHVTSPFLAFLGRNKSGILWQGWSSGTFDPRMGRMNPGAYAKPYDVVRRVLAGGDLGADVPPSLAHLSPAEATREFRSRLFAAGLEGQGEALERSGSAWTGGTEQGELLGRIPGVKPDPEHLGSLKYFGKGYLDTLTGKASINPLNVPGGFGKGSAEGKVFGPIAGGQAANAYAERLGRGATIWAKMMQGYADDIAADFSNMTHVNYRKLSKFNREWARRAFPFFTYTFKMVPMKLAEILDAPGSAQSILARGLTEAQNDEFTPQQLQGTLAIPLGGQDAEGNQTFLSQLDLPFESLNKVAKFGGGGVLGTLGGTARSLLGQANPLITAIPEMALGKTLFQGRNLEETDPLLQRTLSNVTGGATPVGQPTIADIVASKLPTSRYLSTIRTLADDRKSYLDRVLGASTGARLPTVNLPRAKAIATGEAVKQTMKELGGRSREIVTIKDDVLGSLSAEQQRRVKELKALLRGSSRDQKKAG